MSLFYIFFYSSFRFLIFKKLYMFEEQLLRYNTAKKFIDSLSIPPLIWHVVGSTSIGVFNDSSDIDIFSLYHFSNDIPLPKESDDFMFFLDGYIIDYHSYAEDWLVFKLNPLLLQNILSFFDNNVRCEK